MERTENPYKTHGPDGDDGETWHEYFQRLRQEREAQVEENADEPILLIVPGREAIDGDPIPSAVSTWVKRLRENGFTVKVGYSRSFQRGKVFKSGDREGEARPDVTLDQSWIMAYKPGKGMASITYQQPVGGRATCIRRMHSQSYRLVGDAELREWIKDADMGS